MVEALLIVIAVGGLCAALCVGEGLLMLAEKMKPGCVERLCDRIFR